ncbi:MAG: DUF6326 family protein [Candidatus Microbacterium phytovorans]|uniref:DUF6326 family protein n=1 Tax=Candidatus Microbacterium phytovorans TaxID=3121374 RepID=A0AAJ6B4V1_9MICO|nr:DUF6326 family protein [Microbacterium sp.]WEK13146.1 MAG: DUF6326 family protein [Microbacterium sp.]
MTTATQASRALITSAIPAQLKIAAAWASAMFLYIYVDILNFYKPGVVDGILEGQIWRFDVSAGLLSVFLVSMSIPALMIVLSTALPARLNRITNLVVAALFIPYTLFNAAGSTWEWAGFYTISIGLEVLLLAYILRTAWAWPRAAVRDA